MQWILEHYDALISALLAVLAAASAVTALTPTPKDDEFVRVVLDYVSFLRPRDQRGLFAVPFKRSRAAQKQGAASEDQ